MTLHPRFTRGTHGAEDGVRWSEDVVREALLCSLGHCVPSPHMPGKLDR
jgi:hypothetical protein